MTYPRCHWRKGYSGGPYNCESPIAGPLPNLTERDCQLCRVQGHFDTDPITAQRINAIQIPPAFEGGIAPRRIWRVQVPSGSFQGSLLDFNGRLLYAYRAGWLGGHVHLADLGADFPGKDDLSRNIEVVRQWPSGIDHGLAFRGREDPRLFSFHGHLHVSFNGLHTARSGELASSMMLARLSGAGHAQEVWVPHYPPSEVIEKNWQYFENDGHLYCTYSIEPHIILRMDGVLATEVYRTVSRARWDWGHLRGGAPPVRVDDEFYHFFHGQIQIGRGTPERKVVYVAGVYTFEAQPPFAMKRFAATPVMVPPPGETSPRKELTCIFPCGAVLRGDSWYLSYGHNDIDCRIAEFAFNDVEGLLKPLRLPAVSVVRRGA